MASMEPIWTERVVALIAAGNSSASSFADMEEDAILSHPFFPMLNDLWNQSQRETKHTAKKHILTEEEKTKRIEDAQKSYIAGLVSKSTSVLAKKIKDDYPHLAEEEGLPKKMAALGFALMVEELEKLKSSNITATKTLAGGRVVGNHNNYHREENELVKDADGKKLEISVDFKSGTEICGIIPTRQNTKGFTFTQLADYKSVERAESKWSQVFVKPMVFTTDPRHLEGRCGCANGINKKINNNLMMETLGDDGMKSYSPSKLTFTPTFACNNKIHANGMCKTHAKMTADGKAVAKWTEGLLGDWKVEEYTL